MGSFGQIDSIRITSQISRSEGGRRFKSGARSQDFLGPPSHSSRTFLLWQVKVKLGAMAGKLSTNEPGGLGWCRSAGDAETGTERQAGEGDRRGIASTQP